MKNKIHLIKEENIYFRYEVLKLNLMEETINVQKDASQKARKKYEKAERELDNLVHSLIIGCGFGEVK